MKCDCCGTKLVFKKGRYNYRESGLDNVFLDGVEIAQCRCGETVASIPRPSDLHAAVAKALANKDALLTGKEIRFLRKNMGFSSKRLAEILGVDAATVSRWEAGTQKVSRPIDRLVRLVYASEKGLDARRIIEEQFSGICPGSIEKDLCIPVGEPGRSF